MPNAPIHLRCEYATNPLGIDVIIPRLSWQLDDLRQGAMQSAYQVQVAGSPELLGNGKADLWDSGQVKSDQSTGIEYAGLAMKSTRRGWWRVRVWDQSNEPTPWSESACWEMGLLSTADWRDAAWIATPIVGGGRSYPPTPLLRREFELPDKPRCARLYMTALGLYDAELNGQRITEDQFRPGWTDYSKRVQYQTYDVTSLLRTGANVLGAMLGDGWYCGKLGWSGRQRYGDRPALKAVLVVQFGPGQPDVVIATDDAWRFALGPILQSDIQCGESYDARYEIANWSSPGKSAGSWMPVQTMEAPAVALVAQRSPSVRRVAELKCVADPVMKHSNEGALRYIFDFGQNMAGRARLSLQAPRGVVATLRFAEMLQDNGELYTENLRAATATDTYTFRGDAGAETFEPRFTFHGFRYVEIAVTVGKGIKIDRDTLTAIALSSDTPATGEFECSEAMINKLQSCIQWGQRSNFLEVPTDCPQRDERLGWTGDAQIFIPTACFNSDVAAFFTKWQDDLSDTQSPAGAFPSVAPNPGLVGNPDGGPAWADAGIICP